MANMQLYSGKTWHKRFLPKAHGFVYGYNMWGVWLDTLDNTQHDLGLNNTCWFSAKRKLTLNRFKLADYLPEPQDNKNSPQDSQNTLAEKVKNKLFTLTQVAVAGRVLALVNVRTLGYYFSPVNFYIGFDAEHNPSHLLAEVSNTPWNETHYYGFLLTGKHTQYSHAKAFKVSPFNAVNERYDWQINIASKEKLASGIRIVISLHTDKGKVFHAGVNLSAHAPHQQSLPKQALQSLAENQLTFARIYWQAFKLFAIKKIPYVAYTPLHKQKSH